MTPDAVARATRLLAARDRVRGRLALLKDRSLDVDGIPVVTLNIFHDGKALDLRYPLDLAQRPLREELAGIEDELTALGVDLSGA